MSGRTSLMLTVEQSMNKSLTPLDVDRLKREAKRMASRSGIPLNKAQAQVAQRDGYRSWELLQRSVQGTGEDNKRPTNGPPKPEPSGDLGPASVAHIKAQCVKFIKGLDDASVFRVCWNGSIWISLDDFESGTLSRRSFSALGPIHDGPWAQIGYADGMTPLLNMDGLADRFVLDTDVDDDGNPEEPNDGQIRYTVENGRAELISIAVDSIEVEVASVELALLNRDAQT